MVSNAVLHDEGAEANEKRGDRGVLYQARQHELAQEEVAL